MKNGLVSLLFLIGSSSLIHAVEIQTKPDAVTATSTGPEALLNGFIHPPVIFSPGEKYGSEARKYQGIPTIERSSAGRLWAAWYAGPINEDQYNYAVVATSGDDGKIWSDLKLVIDPDGDGPLRASDPCFWMDPNGKLWLFWWMNGSVNGTKVNVTMSINTENPNAENPIWTEPKALFSGVMLNKPLVAKNGEWLMPASIWRRDESCRLMVSQDQGKTWELRGTANIPAERRNCDEPMLVERTDGSLWQLVRTLVFGIGETTSTDGGRTWAEVKDYLPDAMSRFHLRRLQSGNLLLIKHGPLDKKIGRNHLTAYLSSDDGVTWKGGLVIDERNTVSYPDATQAPNGTIYVVYDWNRSDEKHILMTTFAEQDILAKAYVSPAARSRVLVNYATGVNPKKPQLNTLNLRSNEEGSPLLTGPQAMLNVAVAEQGTVGVGTPIFSNRAYAFSDEIPECLQGKRFHFSAMEKTKAICTTAGIIYVLTAAPDRNTDSIAVTLEKQGFAKTSIPEFVLFVLPDGRRMSSNTCCVYQKEVKEGETVEFGKWGVLVF